MVIQADATGDEICVKFCLTRLANQFDEIVPRKWLASGKTDLQNTKRRGFTNDPFPFFRRKLTISVATALRTAGRFAQRSGYRVRAIRAMQGTSVRDFRKQCVWAVRTHFSSSVSVCTRCFGV